MYAQVSGWLALVALNSLTTSRMEDLAHQRSSSLSQNTAACPQLISNTNEKLKR